MNFSEERESWGEDDVLLDEVQFQTEAVDGHPVLEVAIEPVRLIARTTLHLRDSLRKVSILPNSSRPVRLAVSTSTNSSTIRMP
jgi:hypothetical protein